MIFPASAASARSVVALLLLATPAMSVGLCLEPMCSCIAPPGDFLIPIGAEIPADSRGLPFWGLGHVQWIDGERQLFETDAFTVERLVDGRRVRLRAEVELLDGPMVADSEDHRNDWLMLVSPAGGFVPGGQYVFTYNPVRSWRQPTPRRTVVVVSELAFARLAAEEAPSLEVAPATRQSVRVEAGAMCSTEIDAVTVPITMNLPPALQRWQDILLYTVTIDGEEIWRPQSSVCSDVHPGESWQGRTRELLFTDCRVLDEENAWERPDDSLDPGFHRVVMSAWWPGVEARASAAAVVELSCDAPAPPASAEER